VFYCDQLEDPEERVKQEAAKNFVGTATAPARTADSTVDNDEQISDADEVSLYSNSRRYLTL